MINLPRCGNGLGGHVKRTGRRYYRVLPSWRRRCRAPMTGSPRPRPRSLLMKRLAQITLIACATLLCGALAQADVTLNSIRVGAKDTEALAKFYKAAFGMEEVNRIQGGGCPEIFLNFGSSVDTAKANKGLPVVLMHRDADDMKDPVAHIIFNVTDMTATVAAIKAAGGTMTGDPRPFGNTGIVIGIAIDPVGNRIELIQRAAAR